MSQFTGYENKTEKAKVGISFRFQCKVELCMFYLGYIDGLVENSTNKKHS